MSEIKKETIKCPNCKKDVEVDIWGSINVDLDPKMKEKVLNKTAFVFECPYCKEKNNLVYTFLYHDMSKQYMIYQVASDETEKDINQNTKIATKYSNITDGYKYRIVRDPNDLIESILIFDDKLDDVVICILKTIVLNQLSEDELNELTGIYYDSKDKKNMNFVVLLNEKSFGCSIPIEAYDEIKKENKIKLPEGFVEINLKTFSKYI